jgi:hypothetical protein
MDVSRKARNEGNYPDPFPAKSVTRLIIPLLAELQPHLRPSILFGMFLPLISCPDSGRLRVKQTGYNPLLPE